MNDGALIGLARHYQSKQLYHAALQTYQTLVTHPLHEDTVAEVWDSMGMCYIALGLTDMAIQCFERAEGFAQDRNLFKYQAHTALSYSFSGDHDKAQRVLNQCLEFKNLLTASEMARVHANLAYVMSNAEFYRDALEHTKKAIALYSNPKDIPPERRKSLYINMGYFLLELSSYNQALYYLQEAVLMPTEPVLPAITDLSRAYIATGQTEKSLFYAELALNHVWNAVMNFERSEIAQLCRLTATLAYYMGERHLALRLIEKAQMYFGQLGVWGAWLETRDTFEEWKAGGPPGITYRPSTDTLNRLNQYLLLLDAIQAQGRIGENTLSLIDCRVLYSRALAEELGVPKRDLEDMVYAARFADYGLCALEPEVVENPRRSTAAWEQYKQHPILTLEMLEYALMPETIKRIILEHHERFDGDGFPKGKRGDDISILSQIVAVADHYATIVTRGGRHEDALQTILRLNGIAYSPIVINAFRKLFESPEGGQ